MWNSQQAGWCAWGNLRDVCAFTSPPAPSIVVAARGRTGQHGDGVHRRQPFDSRPCVLLAWESDALVAAPPPARRALSHDAINITQPARPCPGHHVAQLHRYHSPWAWPWSSKQIRKVLTTMQHTPTCAAVAALLLRTACSKYLPLSDAFHGAEESGPPIDCEKDAEPCWSLYSLRGPHRRADVHR